MWLLHTKIDKKYAEKYIKEILEIDEHNVDALWAQITIYLFDKDWNQFYIADKNYSIFTENVINYIGLKTYYFAFNISSNKN